MMSDEDLSPASSRSSSRTPPAGHPLIIFDWDDTLLCSSAINQSRWTLQELEELEIAVDSILSTSMSIAETMIVTNGNATWVQDSARRFLPRLLPTLAKVQVVSARAMFESRYPGDPFMWKEAAFRKLLTQDRSFSDCGLNLVALGDQMPEIKAAHYVTGLLGAPSRAKTVKFKEQPSIPELIGQLNRTERELAKLVAEEAAGHCAICRRDLPPHLEHIVSQAAGWKFTEATTDIIDGVQRKISRGLSVKDFWSFFP